jgi:hypothetical protein
LQEIVIPESHYLKPLRPEPGITAGVVKRIIRVLPAVKLDQQGQFHAGEVGDVPPDGLLAAELVAELFATQKLPHPALGVGRVIA